MATTAQYFRLNLPISASNREVIVKASRTLLDEHARFAGGYTKKVRHEFFRQLLEIHTQSINLAIANRL